MTSVILENMRPWLICYPNHLIAAFLTEGFPLPIFSGSGCTVYNNLSSVDCYIDVVNDKLSKEVSAGRMAGPFSEPPFVNF